MSHQPSTPQAKFDAVRDAFFNGKVEACTFLMPFKPSSALRAEAQAAAAAAPLSVLPATTNRAPQENARRV